MATKLPIPLPPKHSLSKLSSLIKVWTLPYFQRHFRDNFTSKISQYFENLDPPLICYQYKKTIRNVIFNYMYNIVTSDPNVRSSIQS